MPESVSNPHFDPPVSARFVLRQPAAIAFRLIHNEATNWEAGLASILNDPTFQDKVKSALQPSVQMQLFQQKAMWGASGPAAYKAAHDFFKPLPDVALRHIESTPEWQMLNSNFKTWKEQLRYTREGLWLSNNKEWLFASGAIVAAGGLAATYKKWHTDSFFDHTINGKKMKLISGGAINFAVTPAYKPSTHSLNLELQGGQVWETKRWKGEAKFDSTIGDGELNKQGVEMSLLEIPTGTKLTFKQEASAIANSSASSLELTGKWGKHGSFEAGMSAQDFEVKRLYLGVGRDARKVYWKVGAGLAAPGSPRISNVDLSATFGLHLGDLKAWGFGH